MLQIEVKDRHISGLGFWVENAQGERVPQYLPPEITGAPLIQALAVEAVQIFLGSDTHYFNPGWYPATAALADAINTLARLQAIGGGAQFADVVTMLPKNELARLQQAAEVFATWAQDSHRYTLKGALSIVKTEAARRGLI